MELSPAAESSRGDGIFGPTTVNVVPWPSTDATSIVPPWALTTLFANARPRRPRSFGFVVKNGWKSFRGRPPACPARCRGRESRGRPLPRNEKGSKGRPGRPPLGYFLRPVIAASAAITTSARTATMIVLVSRPAVTRGSTVPTRCSATTVVLPLLST